MVLPPGLQYCTACRSRLDAAVDADVVLVEVVQDARSATIAPRVKVSLSYIFLAFYHSVLVVYLHRAREWYIPCRMGGLSRCYVRPGFH